MEQSFQTSFIPKTPIVKDRSMAHARTSFLSVIMVVIFLSVVLGTGGLYLYSGFLKKSVVQMEQELNLAKNRFEPSRIRDLQTLDRRLGAANQVLSAHRVISPIFNELERITMKTVRFADFNYTTEGMSRVMVRMKGEAVGYSAVALQSDLFSQNRYFIDPVFANLTLDRSGNVLFNVEFSVDPSLISYESSLQLDSGVLAPEVPQTPDPMGSESNL